MANALAWPPPTRARRIGGLAVVVAVIWGLCFVLIQSSLPTPAPLLLAALRALLGGAVLAVYLAARRSSVSLVPWRDRLPSAPLLLGLAIANAAVAFGAMYLAAGRTEAAVASILSGGQPLVLAAAGWALFGDPVSRRSLVGLGVAMLGVVLIAATSSGATSSDGVALALLAMVAPTAGSVAMRRLGSTVDLVATTSAQFIVGGAILFVVSALVEPWDSLRWSPATLSGLFILGVLGTGVAYVVWFWLLARISLVRLGAALFLVPITGVVAAIASGDRPQPIQLAGIVAVLAGVAAVSFAGAASSPTADPAR